MAEDKSGVSGTQIMVALIGAGAVVTSALIANSERLFPTPSPSPSVTSPVPLVGPTASPSGIASSETPADEPEAPPPAASVANVAGAWRADDGSVMTFAQDGDRFSAEQSDGNERVTVEGQVSGRTIRLWIDYFQAANPGLGLRIMNCDGLLDESARRVTYNCINPQTNVTSRANWTKL